MVKPQTFNVRAKSRNILRYFAPVTPQPILLIEFINEK